MGRLLLFGALLLATPSRNDLELPPLIAKTLQQKAISGSFPKGFRLIALSQIADGCVGQAKARPGREEAAQECVLETLRLARAELPHPETSDDGLFVTHFNLILGAADAVGACPDPGLHKRVSERLAHLSLVDPSAHAASYASTRLRWPADQSATLASLGRYDTAHHAQLTARPLEAWRTFMGKAMDASRELPVSEVTGRGVGSRFPRGCAQSYISRYLAEVAPDLAATWWRAYVRQFLVTRGPFPGFREWPRGVDYKADGDSGPIIMSIGASASAFGIAAAKAQGDDLLAAQLETSADVVLSLGAGGEAAQSLLAEAIRFEARWQQHVVPAQ